MNKFRMYPLYEIDGAIGAESSIEQVAPDESQVIEPGVEKEVVAEPNNFEKAFAKRLAAKEAEWEAKNSEKYKDYETNQKAAQFLQKRYNISDAQALREQIELADLQDRAEEQNITPEMQRRLDALEEKAALADKFQQEQEQQKQYQTFRSNLDKFASEKQASADELHQYMFDNQFPPEKMELAYKTMQADKVLEEKAAFEANKEQFKKDSVKEYLDSKKAPKAEGKGAAGTLGQGPPGSWQAADARFKARIEAANKPV
jgi:hypothetical protein